MVKFRNAIGRKVLAATLVLVLSALSVFASALAPAAGFGDAAVYDASCKAVANPGKVEDGYLVRTAGKAVVLSDEKLTVEVEAGSLVQFSGLDSEPVIYVIDGKAGVGSDAAFTVKTPVTEYRAQAGSSIFVTSDADNETAFLEKGAAEGKNLITGQVSALEEGKTIDNSRKGEQTATTRQEYWKADAQAEPEKAPEAAPAAEEPKTEPEKAAEPEKPAEPAREEAPKAEEAKTEPAQPAAAGALTRTFEYHGYTATVEAYIGEAFITYPAFVTDEEIYTAAAAACRAYPQYTQEIVFAITGRGQLTVTYPASYGADEFNFAMDILEKELPYYLDSIFFQAEPSVPEPALQPQAEVKPEPEVQPEPAPEVQPEQAPQPEPEPQPEVQPEPAPESAPAAEPAPASEEPKSEKTPIATSTREEAKSAAEKQQSNFRFGLNGAFIAFDGTGNDYKTMGSLKDRIALLKRARIVVEPQFRFGDFQVGLRVNLEVILSGAGLSVINPFTFNTNGATNIVNSVMQYISVLGYSNEKLGLTVRADRSSEFKFTSPVFESSSREYKAGEALTGQIEFHTGAFTLNAFVDDLDFSAKLAGHSQFAGIRAGLQFGDFRFGFSTIADFKGGIRATKVYPAIDFDLPLTLADGFGLEIEGGAAVQLDRNGLKGMLFEGKLSVTEGIFTIGAGAAYNRGYHFNDLINVGPVDIQTQAQGQYLDVILSAGLNTEHFGLNARVTAPFSLQQGGGRLGYNTVLTKGGNTADITADIFDLQADFTIKKFDFTLGAAINGFTGKLANLLKALKNKEGRVEAAKEFLNPETSTYFMQAQIRDEKFGLFFRAELKDVNSKLSVALSGGLKFSF